MKQRTTWRILLAVGLTIFFVFLFFTEEEDNQQELRYQLHMEAERICESHVESGMAVEEFSDCVNAEYQRLWNEHTDG